MTSKPNVTILARVIYSAGTVFDGLRTGRLDTEEFLRSGNTEHITSRADLALLEDLRDAAALVIGHGPEPIDTTFVREINAAMSRSGALHPGRLRTAGQHIGVSTRYGRHEPTAMSEKSLGQIIADATRSADATECAIRLFVEIAKAQPFEDGNKRTAVFAANALLLDAGTNTLLTIPVDENDPSVAERFNDLLARAYVLGEDTAIKNMLREQGVVQVES